MLSLLEMPVNPAIIIVRRRGKQRELILLLLWQAEQKNIQLTYKELRQIITLHYPKDAFIELMHSLYKSELIIKDEHTMFGNVYLTDKGRALTRNLDKKLKNIVRKRMKLFFDAQKK